MSKTISLTEMGKTVTLKEQLEEGGGPVILINKFNVPAEDVKQFMAAWIADSAFMKRQPGFISTQLHQGIAGSDVWVNYAVWESTDHFKAAFTSSGFQDKLADYPSAIQVSPHLLRKVAVHDVCVA